MPHISSWQFLDYSREKSDAAMFTGAITALTIAGFLTAFGGMRTALDAITTGTLAKEQWVGDNTVLSTTPPTDENSQRELKWLVVYSGDTTHKTFQMTIPTADPVGRLVPGTDLADLSETDMAAFVTAFEAFARTPDSDTETVTVQQVRLVGRNI